MRVAIVGTGIAGNVVAHLLSREHDLVVFEQNDYVGGHTNTERVEAPDGAHEVDTGFIAYNEERYPNFVRLLRKLDVATQASSMSFSVHSEVDGLEYSNQSLFAQRRNLASVSTPVTSIRREQDHVLVTPRGGEPERFDEVVIASHGDEALALLADPTEAEREILGSFRFQENVAVLHTDTRLMPRARRAWACWNAHVPRRQTGRVALTYDMNLLQGIRSREEYPVTLNRAADIDPAKTIRTIRYYHPVFSSDGVRAQKRHAEISGRNRTHFCGAYWGFGFHEDGVTSGLSVARRFGKEL